VRRYRQTVGKIDLITAKGRLIAFAEVKTRTTRRVRTNV
jgi:Holliday junction resolvase-like predicted endonuclease